MTRHDDDYEVERLLRAALEDEASRYHPAGDGLTRIRDRVAARRRRVRWFLPAVALAGAAAAIAVVVAAPSVLTGSGASPTPIQPGTGSRPSASASTPQTAAAGGWGTPIAGDVNLPDHVTAWPYASRREGNRRADADIASGRFPDLADPKQTAVDFVSSFVTSSQNLVASTSVAYDRGIRVIVSRRPDSGATVPVSTVYLVRVRPGNDAPYVVVGAGRTHIDAPESLGISAPPTLRGTAPVTVNGFVRRSSADADPKVWVQLREPGGTESVGANTVPVMLSGAPVDQWTTTLTPFRSLPATGVIAAWTQDDQGQVTEFVAAPTAP